MTTFEDHKGHVFRQAWIDGVNRYYVADWDELPHWQQETDSDIFEHIERDVQAG
jgi:hypothetical protein